MSSEPFRPLESAHAGQFNTTHWSVVLLAGKTESAQSAEALEKLCRTYWPPLYSFIRRRGYRPEDAQDLTQKFFALLLQRRDFGTADPRKGKFRTFLLTALTHFLANERDWAEAAKRGGGKAVISLNALESEQGYLAETPMNDSPDKSFDARWAATVLDKAFGDLQSEMQKGGKTKFFEQTKIYLTNEPGAGDYAASAARLQMTSQALAVAIHRLRQRYRELVRAEVAQTVTTALEVEEEMRHLYRALTEQ
jgi:DNA-directed RNA polymerase specialized sigma24 family protein